MFRNVKFSAKLLLFVIAIYLIKNSACFHIHVVKTPIRENNSQDIMKTDNDAFPAFNPIDQIANIFMSI